MSQKNFLKIPVSILARAKALTSNHLVVATVVRLRPTTVSKYVHLGIGLDGGVLRLPSAAVPHPKAGRYSKANVEGKDVVRKDLPMVPKTYSWDTPNWGDWSKGSHMHSMTRDVYQRDFIPPKELELSMELIESAADGSSFVVRISVDQVLDRRADDFGEELLYNLNLLQENVGSVAIFASSTTPEEYAATVRVDWEILPPGKVDDVVARMLRGKGEISKEQRRVMTDRVTVMSRMKPEAFITGTNGFLRYFGAKFSDTFVAFENLRYGNALYVMFEGWELLSRRSRIDLLKGPRSGFERIEHREGWEEKFARMLEEHRK